MIDPPSRAATGASVPPNPWTVLILVCLAQFMVVLDGTVVNVALPSIQQDLRMRQSELQWIVNGYTLIFGGFLLLGGRAGDLLGRKRLFLAGIVVFTIASLLNGLATNAAWLIVARGLQGFGGAFIAPAALSIVTTTFAEGEERAKAMGIWTAIAAGGGAAGLLLGGVLTDVLSWRWVFFVNLPIGLLALLLSMRYVPESSDRGHHQGFDLAGAITVTAGLIALVYGIVQTSEAGWLAPWTLASMAVGVLLLAAFVAIEHRAREPLVRLSIFRVRTIRSANLVLLIVSGGLFAMFFFNSVYVQNVLGYSAIRAGIAFFPVTVGILASTQLSRFLVRRIGLRGTAIAGLTLSTFGMLLMLRLDVRDDYVGTLLPSILFMSVGMGLTFVPVTLIATTGVEADDAGLASGLLNTSQQVGGALGLAVLSTLASARINTVLATMGAAPSPTQQAEALILGFRYAFLGAAMLMALAIVLLVTTLRPSDFARVEAGGAPTDRA